MIDPQLHIYILAGQSNMSGRGELLSADLLPDKEILMLDDAGELVPAKDPLHYYEPDRPGTGPGIPFAQRLLELTGHSFRIALVPCAVGGSAIEQWLANEHYRGVTLYSNLLLSSKIAATKGTIKGLLWHQGESNSKEGRYENYRQQLKTFFEKYRKDIGQPDLPIYAGHLGSFLDPAFYPHAKDLNNDLDSLQDELDNFYVVPADDLGCLADQLHFNRDAVRKLGERLADKLVSHSRLLF